MRHFAQRLHGDSFIFQHENDSKHKDNIVTNYLRNHHIEVHFWSPQSQDVNPIENWWAEPNRKVNKRTCMPK